MPVLLGIGQKSESTDGPFSGGSIILVISFVVLILIFQVGVYPVLTAAIAAAFTFTVRWANTTIEETHSNLGAETK
ncbi:hypothetical protein [Roseibacillus persicicus]|uniref:hypothetical protein n=1 Tax=Roseibacillus persicicus TaxID=454148 RepID=UPI002812147F|nr:hypothetical protein [Roseibacillus persicicus]